MIDILAVYFSLVLVSIAIVLSAMPEKKKDPARDKLLDEILADVESFSHRYHAILRGKGYDKEALTAHDAKGIYKSLEATYRRKGERDKLEKLPAFAEHYLGLRPTEFENNAGHSQRTAAISDMPYNRARDDLLIIDAVVSGARLKNWKQHKRPGAYVFDSSHNKYHYGNGKNEYLGVIGGEDHERLKWRNDKIIPYAENFTKKRRELKTNPLSGVRPYEVEDIETAVKIAGIKKSIPRELVDGYLRKIEKLAGFLRKTPEENGMKENRANYDHRILAQKKERESFYRGSTDSKQVKKLVDADSDSIYKRLTKKAKKK